MNAKQTTSASVREVKQRATQRAREDAGGEVAEKRESRGPRSARGLKPTFELAGDGERGEVRVYVGDCRELLGRIPEAASGVVDLVFADPPFNWNRDYDRWKRARLAAGKDAGASGRAAYEAEYRTWHDAMPREDYLEFTRGWIGGCARALRPGGAMWINIPDDTAAEIVVFVKNELGFELVNWCVWHYRFGQNRTSGFINSKVHALYFVKPGEEGQRTWNAGAILEPSDRASTYFDARTLSKKDGVRAGYRVPMDVWYGAGWGRIQGNNKERRGRHDNQLPEAYLERVILSTSNPGDVVLDPFLGSGTTGVVARAYGRRFVGCEFSRANAASAFERIKSGMVNKGVYLGQPTAIFRARGAGKATVERFKGVVGGAGELTS
jgi:DNA modification methylase